MNMLSLKKARMIAASARGYAQAFDLTGAIASRRLRSIQARTAGEALARDWANVGGDLRQVTTRWIRERHG